MTPDFSDVPGGTVVIYVVGAIHNIVESNVKNLNAFATSGVLAQPLCKKQTSQLKY